MLPNNIDLTEDGDFRRNTNFGLSGLAGDADFIESDGFGTSSMLTETLLDSESSMSVEQYDIYSRFVKIFGKRTNHGRSSVLFSKPHITVLFPWTPQTVHGSLCFEGDVIDKFPWRRYSSLASFGRIRDLFDSR